MVESTAKLRDEIMAVAGVDILDETGRNFKSTVQIMRELAQVWDQLDGLAKQGILDKIAGKRGSVAVSAALQNWDIVEKTIKGASEESVGSMDQQLEVYNQSIQASLDKFKVAFQELSTDLINSDLLKGLIDAGTHIIQIIDELVKHIGILGTALTGLGIAKIFSTAVNGAKSVEGWGKTLSLVFDELATGSTTAAERMTAMEIVLTALKDKGAGAGVALKGTASSIATLAGSFPLLTAGILGAVAAFTAFSYIKHRTDEIDKQASASAKEWNESKTAIQDYATEYKSLKDSLKDTNLSEAERIGIKQQLLDLQNQIVSLYGDEVSGIDLVNGGLTTQEEILARIAQQKAKDNINDNFIGYYRAEDAMTRDRTYRIAGVRNQSAKLQEEYARIFNSDKVKDMFKLDETTMHWVFTGDASEADEAFKIVTDDLEKLKEGASETDASAIQSTIDSITRSATENQKTLTKYRDTYNAYLEQQVFEQGFGDEASEYAKRIQEYNDALLGGDLETIIAKRSEVLDYYDNTIKNILGEHDEFTDYFSGIREQIDTSSEALIDWKDIVEHDTPAAGNTFAKSADKIKSTINELKKLELDSVDIQAILGNPENVNYGLLEQLAKLWNPDIDLADSIQRSAFADFLAQLGVGAQDASDNIDLAKSSFEDFLRLASASIETLEKANAALVNSFGNKGLSMGIDAETGEITGDVAAIISAYKDLDGYDAGVLFERTADGINVNTDALRALQSEQEATIKADFVRRIAEAQVELGKAGSAEAKQYWEDQLETVKLLSTAYDGATSSYQKWIDAQKMTSPGSKYDTIVDSALKQAKDYYDKGLVGNPVFQSIAQLFTNEDLSLATTEEITKAYEDGLKVVSKYFTTGQEGAKAFADKLVELNLAKKEGDEYDFSESGINTTELANELGISVDLVEAAFGKLQEYGWTINFLDDDQVTKLGELGQKANEAKDKLAELADEEGKVGSTDISSVIDIDVSGLDTIDECNTAIEQINEAKANAEVDSDEYEYLDSLLQDITLMRDVLEQGTKPTVDDSDLTSVQATYDSLVSRMTLLDHMNAAPGVSFDIDNDEQVRELAETLLNIDDEEYKAKIGIDGIDTVDGIIEKLKEEHINIPVTTDTSGVQTSVNTSGTVDYSTGSVEALGAQSAVVNYTTGTIEPIPVQTAKIDYSTDKIQKIENQKAKIDYSIGSLPSIPNPSATINYTASITGLNALPKDGERRDVYVDVHTAQKYKGTVTRSAFQSMSSSGSVTGGSSHANGTLGRVGLKHDENALINELGAEIVVRPSEDSWMIFNDGKPTFASLKKDDVIFSADLSRQLLEKGKTDDYARLLSGGSHVRGTVKGKAHAVVTGRGKFKTPQNTTKKKKSGNGGGGGGGGNTPKEAKDFKETLDEIEILIDRIERRISNLDTVASNTFNSLAVRNSALGKSLTLVSKEIDNQTAAYKRYITQANKVGLDSKLAEKVRNGKINIEDIKDEKVWKKVESYRKYYEAALSARDAIYQLRVEEGDLWNQRFDLYQTSYENRIAQFQHIYDMMDNYIDLAENTGRISANKYRDKQITEEGKKIDMLKAEYTKLETTMKNALASGKITIDSEGYYEMLGALNDINENLVQAKANVEELRKSIRETNWEIFDKGAESISAMNDELEFLYGLLGDDEDMFDDKGIVNDDGIAGFGILSAQYNVAMQEAKRYAEEIKNINDDIKDDEFNQDLIDRRQELYESQRKAIESANDYKESISDLVETGIKKQIDSLKELISNYEDLMDTQKDEIDYAKRISDAQSNVNKIQKQLNAYANDDTEEGASRRQKLRNDLKNAQDNLEQTQEERRMSQTKKLLSDLQDEYENVLNARLDNLDALVQAVVDGVDANATTIKTAIDVAATNVGYSLTSEVGKIFDDASKGTTDLASYFTNGDFLTKVTSISTAVSNIEQRYKDAENDANNTANSNIGDTTKAQSSTKSTMESAAKQGTKARNAANKITGIDGSWVTDKKTGNRTAWKFSDGTYATGWSKIDGKQYYFDEKGKLKTGLQTIGKSKYYIRSKSGKAVNQWQQVGKKWYYFDKNGKAVNGWQNLTKDGKKGWFYFNPDTNQMAVNSWIKNSSKKGTYYVGANGMMFINGKFKTKDGYRTFDKNGKWKGYKTGTRSVGASGLYWTNEGVPETIIRKSDGAVLTKLNSGDTVLNNSATQNMWDFANNPQKFLRGLGVNNTFGNGNNVSLEFNLSGLRSPAEFMEALRKDKKFEKLIQEMTLGRVNGHGVLAKNAIRI